MKRVEDVGRVTGRIPPGEAGSWRVTQFEVDAAAARYEAMRAFNPSTRGRGVPAGTYTALHRGGTLVMSDTPDELRDLDDLHWNAKGRVLIHGLGLGCALQVALASPRVTAVDVVELAPEVLQLVAPSFTDPRVRFHQGDAYTFRFPAGSRWDVAWHDVWDTICADNRYSTLRRRYGRRVGWQGCWAEDLVRR